VVTPYIRVDLPELLAEVCSKTDCLEIAADGSRGIYGKYSGCSMAQRASYALDRYYVDKHRRPEHCDFGKRAALTTTFGTLAFTKTHTADGRTCEEILGHAQGDAASNDGDVLLSEQEGGLKSTESFHSAAQKPANWGFVVVSVFVVSFMYLAT